jgi:hypothetical protein
MICSPDLTADCQRFYFRASKIAEMSAEMVRSPRWPPAASAKAANSSSSYLTATAAKTSPPSHRQLSISYDHFPVRFVRFIPTQLIER